MKSLKKIKAFSSLGRKNGNGSNDNSSSDNIPQIRADTTEDAQGDGPAAIAARNVRLFCESSGGPDSDNEILFLPPIVDAAESSPEAAAECARIIRQYLRKQYKNKPNYQYNAIMLTRILSDNPGPSFTRNIDQKFTDTCKAILTTDDRRVNQMMMDTLDAFENTKSYDENLYLIISMWQQEKHKALRKAVGNHNYNFRGPPPQVQHTRSGDPHSQNYFARQHAPRRTLPDPVELAGRLEEARTSAKVLHDIVANTPPQEVLGNDLIKEFADRCLSASRSIQGYMAATDPTPDHDTMESLIDTNEQLQASMSLHQRAMLNARKQAGENVPEAPSPVTQSDRNGSISRNYDPVSDDEDMMRPPPGPPPNRTDGKGKQTDYLALGSGSAAGPSRSHTPRVEEDPFKDPEPEAGGSGSGSRPGKGKGRYDSDEETDQQRHFNEPFHPGFGSTPSYVNRQESAVGKEAMHGAVPAPGASSSEARRGSTDSYDFNKEGRSTYKEMYRY